MNVKRMAHRRPLPLQNEEEFKMVKESVLLPLLLDVLERDAKLLKTIPLKLPDVYLHAFRRAQDRVCSDLVLLRKTMRKHQLNVYEHRRTKLGVEADYLYQGYHHHFSMLWGLIRAELETRLHVYFGLHYPSTPNLSGNELKNDEQKK